MIKPANFNTRVEMASSLLSLIRPLKQHLSSGRGFLNLSQTGVHYGSRAARMEGFARILWGLGPLFSQSSSYEEKKIQNEAAEWKAIVLEGIATGTDPEHEEYWGDMADFDQRIVEATALVVMFCLNKEMWQELPEAVRSHVYQWLNQMNHCEMPRNNWRFFRILTNMTFRLLNLPYSKERVKEDKELIENSYVGGGWYVDGGSDKMDYYIAFAFHFYGQIYASFMKELDPVWSATLMERREVFSRDFIYMFNNDGTSVPFGRSLTYRFAHVSFFSAFAFLGGRSLDYGVIKNLICGNLKKWFELPIMDHAGVMTVGYQYPNLIMSEHYNGCGSPYWALKAFLVLALPEDHEFWRAKPKTFTYEKQKKLSIPHMIITHDQDETVMAYVAGQHCPGNHGHVSEKYEKFVYSNRFGFSISRGYELNDGAFDNTIAFSHSGENRYTMMNGCLSYVTEEDFLRVTYHPINGVTAESIIVPCSPWHVRIHRIVCEQDIDVSEGGFCLPAEDESGKRYEKSQLNQGAGRAAAVLPWGISGVVSLTGGDGEVLQCFPNTNLLYPLTVMPLVKHHLKKGSHILVSCVFGDMSEDRELRWNQMPKVSWQEAIVTVEWNGKVTKIV
ncbi:DUF2264 domain-containing protein [Clostridium boliviensis]|uniref:DUF2264 domain-containing protein n=1 Tax=Clostridium boliviensis TaxID=318465 RepID=A0ABU4GQU7_9CLOT|nr:DUF2264 domain-containing protein [Clostridium boliviensis]MDW2800015.1 DUF2264 domain-containing protein [Clostridium boliviensis]